MVLLSESSSDISSLSSDSPEADNDYDSPLPLEEEPSLLPPSKRQKLGADGASRASSSVHVGEQELHAPDSDDGGGGPEIADEGDISSDTDGDVPNSPINAKLDEEEFQEQVTVCAWDGCRAGDLGNMDKLVEHIHNDHIESRQKKYTCEWNGCPRKSMPHASGYALKAHMRSHTREKPFYCYLPECDRAFTISDALAKHMRTVHETEALRPSDPVPKSMQTREPARGPNKLKIILKTQQPRASSSHHDDGLLGDDGDGSDDAMGSDFFTPLTEQQGFTDKELKMDPESLWKICVAHLKWATGDGEALRDECRELEGESRLEWLEKEVLLDQVKQVEEDWWRRRKAVLAGEADVKVSTETLKATLEPEDEGSAAPEAVDSRDEDPIEVDE
ncbi:INO80 complex subunit 1 [Apiospora phragmitis]|uniref:INO80 complex subunit 1 n=1 Tax=Apiospora phragmitis TaxID=2905665 RepID=A0ABR1VFX2_9PEZI